MNIQACFSDNYAQARTKFFDAAAAANLVVTSYTHPLHGAAGEVLAMDVAYAGASDAERLLVISSACHGAEGFCGSGVQVHALHDPLWRAAAQSAGVAVLYVHGLNPYGFSHLRRTTHENIDLNRNFLDFSQPLQINSNYAKVDPLLMPTEWPPSVQVEAELVAYIAEHGLSDFRATVSGGQSTHPKGVFYSGIAPSWSNLVFRKVLRRYAQQAKWIGGVDIHTGLGPPGVGERIFACRDETAAYERAKRWWSEGGPGNLTSIYDGSSSSALLYGMLMHAFYDECAQAEYTAIALEYGSQTFEQVMNALRGDHWLHQHPEAPRDLAAQIKRNLRDAFYVDTNEWREQIVTQAAFVLRQALNGLVRSQ
jgi:Protein of unknown function (DUF2817)